MSSTSASIPSNPPSAPSAPSAPDELVRTVSSDGSVTVRAVAAANLVAEAAERRPLSPTALSALGRLLVGTVLLGTGNKQDETVQVQLRGNGPLGMMLAICDSTGRVRGTVSNPGAHLPLRDGLPDVPKAIGLGVLSVVRHHPSWREPYRGTVPLVSGEVAKDLTLYLTESEQTPSAVGLGVATERDGQVAVAGGFLVQSLPGAPDEALAQVERNIARMPRTSELLRAGVRADGLIDFLLEGLGAGARTRSEPCFYCPCTRQRALRTLVLLGRAEMREIILAGDTQEVCCEFCGKSYDLAPDEIGPLVPDA
jgi:molecular chaperone Hsp33